MQSGKYNTRLRVVKPIKKRDSTGAHYNDYEDARCEEFYSWGNVVSLQGREYWEAMKVNPEVAGRIEMRFRTMTSAMRIYAGSRTFDVITWFDPYNNKKEIHVLVKEAVT